MKNKTIYVNDYGYSPLEDVDINKMSKTVLNNKNLIERYHKIDNSINNVIMVAGAGNGQEAVLINKHFNLKTIGVDINIDKSILPDIENLTFEKQDLMKLDFGDNCFSIIYCSHVLEHVHDHLKVLSELARVLRKDGVLFIGFPNRNRFFGYIGASQKLTIIDVIKWNINDYKYRFKGKFHNRYGAHAGFTQKEFINDAGNYFKFIKPVRNEYMLLKYPQFIYIINMLRFFRIDEIIFPSNYYVCSK